MRNVKRKFELIDAENRNMVTRGWGMERQDDREKLDKG